MVTQTPVQVRRTRERLQDQPVSDHFYAALLGLRTFDPPGLHSRVEAGLSYEALERLREVLDVPLAQLGVWIRVPTRTLARRKEVGRLESDESDRLFRLARVVGLTLQLFEGDLEATREWLTEPQVALAGQTPLDYARTAVGSREVEVLIGRLEHGIPL